MDEFTGQLIGGPADGDLITSSVERVPAEFVRFLWPDGGNQPDTVMVRGWYVWDPAVRFFRWELKR